MARSKAEAALADAALAHADDPARAEVLNRARRFKASWVELAESLVEVRATGKWRGWGYGSFDEYARIELHLRQATVDKLTASLLFLKKRAPEVLARDGVRSSIPTYQAVDFLRRAESHPGATEADEALGEVRKRVLDDGAPLPAIARNLRERVIPPTDDERRTRDLTGLLNAATRLRELLGETRVVPAPVVADAARSLDRLLDAVADARGVAMRG